MPARDNILFHFYLDVTLFYVEDYLTLCGPNYIPILLPAVIKAFKFFIRNRLGPQSKEI